MSVKVLLSEELKNTFQFVNSAANVTIEHTPSRRVMRSIRSFEPDIAILHCNIDSFDDIPEICQYARSTLGRKTMTIWVVFDGELTQTLTMSGVDHCLSLTTTPENIFQFYFQRDVERHSAMNENEAMLQSRLTMLHQVGRSDTKNADEKTFLALVIDAISNFCSAKHAFLYDVSKERLVQNVFQLKDKALSLASENDSQTLRANVSIEKLTTRPLVNLDPPAPIHSAFGGAAILLFPISIYERVRYALVCLIEQKHLDLLTVTNLKVLEEVAHQLHSRLERRYAMAEVNQRFQQAQVSLAHIKDDNEEQIQSEKMLSLSNIAVGLLHEMNNPISSTLGNFEPLKQYIDSILELLELHKQLFMEPNSEAKHEVVAIYYEETDISEILEDIQSVISDSESGLMRVKDVLLSLRVFADKSLDARLTPFKLSSAFSKDDAFLNPEGISVENQMDENLMVTGNRNMLRKVLELVFRNAIDAIDRKDQQGAYISISTRADDQYVRLLIEDNGTGMDSEVLAKVFEPFYTNNGKKNATGLGLTIAQFVMQKLNGSIRIESEPDNFTRVVLKMPVG
ncbi:putative TWO COMPONENT HISTIDINE KINASE [Vibrio nigripulchritudo SOn1]|uniref:histidine kinase n=1 Tax=Vibrio nigripulchritudo SOn1 TaxID=1238450 RepID=A0AAV2VPC3_9VIBR|nr:HAMP domain-containing sensor histidine kinase [Vibrio nigripulchritudo]CCO46227.1 putative TWO COMPONENT HISTIDINE KINASE [Vibrio nigripulchritudo SOn1]